MIPLFIWILCPADIVYLIKIDILGSRIKVMKKWCLRIFIWRYKGICLLYSPRMWRWSQKENYQPWCGSVFSTYVEVILVRNPTEITSWSILHVCGGDPNRIVIFFCCFRYSPRMWRWSFDLWPYFPCWPVFSTYVEVIPKISEKDVTLKGILHVCGGDPVLKIISSIQ